MFFVFVMGVKMDLGVVIKVGKKYWVIVLVGVLIFYVIVWVVVLFICGYMDYEFYKLFFIGGVIFVVVIIIFFVIYIIFRDM